MCFSGGYVDGVAPDIVLIFDLVFKFTILVPLFYLLQVLQDVGNQQTRIHRMESQHTAITLLNLTSPGICLPLDRRAHKARAFSSVAQSTALNGILFAFSMVSIRELAVMIVRFPDDKLVYSHKVGSEGILAAAGFRG